jgi:hypothetical protein
MRRQVALAASLAAVAVAGCGAEDSSDDSLSPARPETVGTLSEESAREPIVQDVKTIRTTLESGQFYEGVVAIHDVIDRAAEMSAGPGQDEVELSQRGAELLRAELPRLVAMLEESEPQARQRLRTARFKTEAGEKLRQIGLRLLTDQLRNFQALRDFIVDNYDPTWGALQPGWGRASTSDVRRKHEERLNELLTSLPPEERKALFRAVREVFGTS